MLHLCKLHLSHVLRKTVHLIQSFGPNPHVTGWCPMTRNSGPGLDRCIEPLCRVPGPQSTCSCPKVWLLFVVAGAWLGLHCFRTVYLSWTLLSALPIGYQTHARVSPGPHAPSLWRYAARCHVLETNPLPHSRSQRALLPRCACSAGAVQTLGTSGDPPGDNCNHQVASRKE